MAKSMSLLFWIYVAQLMGLSWGQSCYTPGGVLSTTHFPCRPSAGTSLCCPMGWTCFSNNLCVATDSDALGSGVPIGTTIRGGCTNQQGDNDLCGDYCLDTPGDSLVSCGGSGFCCGSKASQGLCKCDTGVGTFQAEGGTAQTIMGQTGLVKTATVATSSATSGTSVTTTLSTSTTASRSSGTASNSISDPAASNTSPPTESASAAPISVPFTKKVGFKVLIAIVAVAVFAILVAAAVFILRRRKKNDEDEYVPGPISNESSSVVNMSNVAPLPRDYGWRENPYDSPRPTMDSPLAGYTRETRDTSEDGEIERPPTDSDAEVFRRPPPMASIPMRPYEGT